MSEIEPIDTARINNRWTQWYDQGYPRPHMTNQDLYDLGSGIIQLHRGEDWQERGYLFLNAHKYWDERVERTFVYEYRKPTTTPRAGYVTVPHHTVKLEIRESDPAAGRRSEMFELRKGKDRRGQENYSSWWWTGSAWSVLLHSHLTPFYYQVNLTSDQIDEIAVQLWIGHLVATKSGKIEFRSLKDLDDR